MNAWGSKNSGFLACTHADRARLFTAAARYCSRKYNLYRPLGLQEVETPRFLNNRHMNVARLSALCTGRLYSPWDTPVTHFCLRLNRTESHGATVRIKLMRNPVTPSGIEPTAVRLEAQWRTNNSNYSKERTFAWKWPPARKKRWCWPWPCVFQAARDIPVVSVNTRWTLCRYRSPDLLTILQWRNMVTEKQVIDNEWGRRSNAFNR